MPDYISQPHGLNFAFDLYYRGFRFYGVYGPKSKPTLLPLIEEDEYGSTGEKKNAAAVSRLIDYLFAEFNIRDQFDPKYKQLQVKLTPQSIWIPGSVNQRNLELHWQGKPMGIILVEAKKPRRTKAKSNPGGPSLLHVRTEGPSLVLSFRDSRGANAAVKKLRAAGIPAGAPVRDRLMGCTDIYTGPPGQRARIVDIVRS